jgi:hypothetical protein
MSGYFTPPTLPLLACWLLVASLRACELAAWLAVLHSYLAGWLARWLADCPLLACLPACLRACLLACLLDPSKLNSEKKLGKLRGDKKRKKIP